MKVNDKDIKALDAMLAPTLGDATLTAPVWQGATARNFANLTAAELQALRRFAGGEPGQYTEALAHLRAVLSDAPNGSIEIRFWLGPTRGGSPTISVAALRRLAKLVVGKGVQA